MSLISLVYYLGRQSLDPRWSIPGRQLSPSGGPVGSPIEPAAPLVLLKFKLVSSCEAGNGSAYSSPYASCQPELSTWTFCQLELSSTSLWHWQPVDGASPQMLWFQIQLAHLQDAYWLIALSWTYLYPNNSPATAVPYVHHSAPHCCISLGGRWGHHAVVTMYLEAQVAPPPQPAVNYGSGESAACPSFFHTDVSFLVLPLGFSVCFIAFLGPRNPLSFFFFPVPMFQRLDFKSWRDYFSAVYHSTIFQEVLEEDRQKSTEKLIVNPMKLM